MRRTLALLVCLLMMASTAGAEFIFSSTVAGEEAQAAGTVTTVTGSTPAGEAEASPTPSGDVEIIITAAGDVTIGGNMRKNPSSNMYTKIVEANDGNLAYFFANVYDIFSQDDMTLVNFEGVLSNVTRHKDNDFTFRAPPEHVNVLTLGSVEAVALENNHVMDFYEEGYADTVQALTTHGIVYSSEDRLGVFEVKGISIAMLSYQTFNGQYPRLMEKVPQDIAAAKAEHDLVIVSYHWGDEGEFKPNSNQVMLGRATIDAGADLVLGHHSHRINPIEEYNGKYIVYSLANCSFSGNTKPSNMDTFLFQQKFILKDGEVSGGPFRIIPCSISSVTAKSGAESANNDLAVTPFEPGSKGAQRVINTMLENGKKLDYAVTNYPTEWE